MALIVIPTSPGVPYFRQKTKLEGREYVLDFAYNQRIQRWHLSIFDEEETPLVQGLKLVVNWPLLRHYRYDSRIPPGELMALAQDGTHEPPGIDELGEGKRVELCYLEAADL